MNASRIENDVCSGRDHSQRVEVERGTETMIREKKAQCKKTTHRSREKSLCSLILLIPIINRNAIRPYTDSTSKRLARAKAASALLPSPLSIPRSTYTLHSIARLVEADSTGTGCPPRGASVAFFIGLLVGYDATYSLQVRI